MKKIKILFSFIAISFGAFMFVYGEYDDSPGGQLLGLILVILGIVGIVRIIKKNLKTRTKNVIQNS